MAVSRDFAKSPSLASWTLLLNYKYAVLCLSLLVFCFKLEKMLNRVYTFLVQDKNSSKVINLSIAILVALS